MAGFAKRQGDFTSVEGELEINGLLLESGETSTLLLTFDLLYVGEALRTAALKSIADRVPDAAVLTAASHTHYAPATDSTKPRLGAVDPAYLEFVETKIDELVTALWQAPARPASLFVGQTSVQENINRRVARWAVGPRGIRKQQLAPNPNAPCDDRMRVVDVRGEDGQSLAMIWGYACHPVGFPVRRGIHPGYPGVVRDSLRAGTDTPILFLQGFAGDIRPRVFDRRRSFLPWLRRVLNGPQFGAFTRPEWDDWSAKIASAATTAHHAATKVGPTALEARRLEQPLSDVLTECESQETLSWQRIKIANEIEFIGVSAEPVAAFGHALGESAWAVGCLDHVFGYFPMDSMVPEGGYEVTGFLEPFGHQGTLQSDLDAKFRAAVKSLNSRQDA